MLTEQLNDLDFLIKKFSSEGYATLQKAATKNQLKKLQDCFTKGKIPDELITWFSWHNGQSGDDDLYPDENRCLRFMPVEDAIRHWKELQKWRKEGKALEPLKTEWFPLFENQAGDYYMLNSSDGSILAYYHDSKGRPKQAKSLQEWVEKTARKISKEIKADEKNKKGGVPEFVIKDLSWKKLNSPPAKDEMRKFPVDTKIYMCSLRGPGKVFYYLWTKLDEKFWLKTFSGKNVQQALAEITERVKERKSAGYHVEWQIVWRDIDWDMKNPKFIMLADHKDHKLFGVFISRPEGKK